MIAAFLAYPCRRRLLRLREGSEVTEDGDSRRSARREGLSHRGRRGALGRRGLAGMALLLGLASLSGFRRQH